MTKLQQRVQKEKVVHIMANGEIRDSIEGVVVPISNPVYFILCNGDYEADEEEVVTV